MALGLLKILDSYLALPVLLILTDPEVLVPHGVQRGAAGLVQLQQPRVGRVHHELHAVFQGEVLRKVLQVLHPLLVLGVATAAD